MYGLPAMPSPSSVPPATPGAEDRLSFSPFSSLRSRQALHLRFLRLPLAACLPPEGSRRRLTSRMKKRTSPAANVSSPTDGGSTWTEDGSAAYDDDVASKTYEATRSVRENTTFQLCFAEDVPYQAAISPSVLVQVRDSLSEPTITPDPVPRYADLSVSGELRPYHSGSPLLRFYYYLPHKGWYCMGYNEASNGYVDPTTARYSAE